MTAAAEQGFEDIYFTVRDGLRLYGRHYRARRAAAARPVVCLAGLTRNSRDFHAVALALSQASPPRDVFTLDTRGRGFSEYDTNWKNYAVPIELQDVVDFMMMLGLRDAGIIGTSRGGLITMVLAAVQPSLVGAVVLNDIGPVIEMDGLARIAAYAGRIPLPKNWKDAAGVVLDLTRRDFPKMTEEDAETDRAPAFQRKERQAGKRLRQEAREVPFGSRWTDAGTVAAVRGDEADTRPRRARRQLRSLVGEDG